MCVLTYVPLQKVIFHLEAFVAKFMRIYERLVHSKRFIEYTSIDIIIAGPWAWTSSDCSGTMVSRQTNR
jgi:hypothetical protein